MVMVLHSRTVLLNPNVQGMAVCCHVSTWAMQQRGSTNAWLQLGTGNDWEAVGKAAASQRGRAANPARNKGAQGSTGSCQSSSSPDTTGTQAGGKSGWITLGHRPFSLILIKEQQSWHLAIICWASLQDARIFSTTQSRTVVAALTEKSSYNYDMLSAQITVILTDWPRFSSHF